MKIGICGASIDLKKEVLERSYEIGKLIAAQSYTLIMGAGRGYPLEAAKGCYENNGKVIAISPADNEIEHREKYGFKTDYFSEIIYTGEGIPRRNFDIIEQSDAIIIIGGQIGTLNEFTIAHHMQKVIGILSDSAGITEIIPSIIRRCDKNNESRNIVYSRIPERLVKGVVDKYETKSS